MNTPIIGTKAMVVSPHYLASAAGARILERGGNAYDAAVAISACLAVVYPHMTGLGGDAFWLMYNAGEGKMRAYNASGRSGEYATLDAYVDESGIPLRGPRSIVTVPGMVDGWDAVIREYGRLSLAEVLEPAIRYAKEGFPMSPDQYQNTVLKRDVLHSTASTIYVPNGQIVRPGERFIQQDVSRTLSGIAQFGRDHFYQGSIATEMSDFLQREGSILQFEDFASHHGDWVEPLRGSYRGYSIYQLPPNSQGFVGLSILHTLEQFNLRDIPHGSSAYYHLLVEAIKLNFKDRDRYLTDPEFSSIPLERLLSKSYAKEQASLIQPNHALSLETEPIGNDTAYAAVVDDEGNAVSFIQSLYFEFGSGVVAGNTGVILQNRGSFFSLSPSHVNCLAPYKRTFHTLMPAMACLDGKPAILYGTQGGEGQPQTQTAMITRMIDYDMTPEQAVSEPRFVWGRTWGQHTQELKLESRISNQVAVDLAAKGHHVRIVDLMDGIMGHAHVIKISENGLIRGATDPRCDGAAIGW